MKKQRAPAGTPAFDIPRFLRADWQRRPRLLKQAWPRWRNPLTPDELAGLACESEVESRLILRERRRWQLEHGPFAAARFDTLPARRWTLLVQAVDHYVPAVAALLETFRFIPDWRLDDIMVSYATDGGGVGPHFDHYDVFLLQGLGRRRWRVGQRCTGATPLQPHADIRLLAEFQPAEEWVLDPGDMLYLPPGWAHDGVAIGDDCMTYSIGLRAPSRAELIGHWCDEVIAGLDEDDRYTDAAGQEHAPPGELTPATLARLRTLAMSALNDEARFADWFGRYTSERKYAESAEPPTRRLSATQLARALVRGAVLARVASSRYAFIRHGRGLALYVDGERYTCAGRAAQLALRLCGQGERELHAADVPAGPALALAATLHARGALALIRP